MRFAGLAGVLVLAVAGTTAHAGVIWTVTVGNVRAIVTDLGKATDSFGDLATGYEAYDISVATTDGTLITSVTAGQVNGLGPTGITGPLLQYWDIVRTGERPTADEPGQSNGRAGGLDSHWLVPVANMGGIVLFPREDNDRINPPGSPPDDGTLGGADWGQGSYLTAIFGITAEARASSLDLAYLVARVDAPLNVDMQIADVDRFNNQRLYEVQFPIARIPEPATLALLSLGSLLVLRPRRAH